MENLINNVVELRGMVESEVSYDHMSYGEKFYSFIVRVLRTSGTADVLPVVISERTAGFKDICEGVFVEIVGQFRSCNTKVKDKNKTILYVFAQELNAIRCNSEENYSYKNQIRISGYICKKPIYRETPLGRKISDFILAVHRTNYKSDYLPCIFWGRNAIYSENLEVGTKIHICGRVQSRNYIKKIEDGTLDSRTAYEISTERFEVVARDEN